VLYLMPSECTEVLVDPDERNNRPDPAGARLLGWGTLLPPLLGTAFLFLSVAACSNPTGEGCDICTTEAFVFGTVTDSMGAPVQGIRLEIRASAFPCSEPFVDHGGTDTSNPRTGTDGSYGAVILSVFAPYTASCLRADVNPNGVEPWPTTEVKMSAAFEVRETGTRVDSVRFDIQLPWAPSGG